MKTNRCPSCGGARVRRSSSWLQHLTRLLLSSAKRYCLDCKKRWRVA